ncbi:MAG: YhcH/YjgK/YiaL family protein [Spirochaetales bacterium]|nr:YhcH/YjgK/YiaL family protein [Spirochaetales bacterium]
MILDSITNAEKYEKVHSSFKMAFDFIRNSDLASLETGRYEIDGDNVFALVQAYEPKAVEEKKFEAHRKYIDIQYMISGSEMMGYTTPDLLSVSAEYNPDKDVELYSHSTFTPCELHTGGFAVFFPEDPHMPGCALGSAQPGEVKKLVLKIRQ